MTDPAEFALDETTRGYIGELNAQIQVAANSMNGALALVCRQNKLQGNWRLHPDGTKLIRVDPPDLVPMVNGSVAAPYTMTADDLANL